MKHLLCGLFALMSLSSLACHAEKGDKEEAKSQVPEKYLETISKADSITCLLIDPWSEATENWKDGYGEILASKTSADKELRDEYHQVLANPKAFEEHTVVKNCAFMPDIAIVFHAGKKEVTVAYSFYCDMCRFASGENYVDLDGELVCLDFLKVTAKVYPQDRYIRYLIKKTKNSQK